ncbi:MAG: thioredoxin family protein [Bacteroidales bacterium]|nr:MAG: thioredoxin family protein [Bacteroidales bacterium]
MKRIIAIFALMMFASSILMAQGYKIGDKVSDFKLKNVDGKMISLSDYKNSKGVILIFTCNHCPFAKAYEDRIINIHKKYGNLGFPVVAINPNNPEVQPEDSYDLMVSRAKEKGFPFAYLFDEGQKVYPVFGATKTPHVFLLNKKGNDMVVEYIGTIDDNYKDASMVKEKYLENAVDALLAGRLIAMKETKAVGCGIKVKR